MNKFHRCLLRLALLLIIFQGTIYAQNFPLNKKNRIITSGFNISNSNHQTDIQIESSYGYFIKSKLALSILLKFAHSSQKKYNQTDICIGPRLFYFLNGKQMKSIVKGSTYPYLSASILYNDITKESKLSGISKMDIHKGIIISFGCGISHMITNTVGLFSEAVYERHNSKNYNKYIIDNFLNINVGFLVFIY